jgi:hypothetical protein
VSEQVAMQVPKLPPAEWMPVRDSRTLTCCCGPPTMQAAAAADQ